MQQQLHCRAATLPHCYIVHCHCQQKRSCNVAIVHCHMLHCNALPHCSSSFLPHLACSSSTCSLLGSSTRLTEIGAPVIFLEGCFLENFPFQKVFSFTESQMAAENHVHHMCVKILVNFKITYDDVQWVPMR